VQQIPEAHSLDHLHRSLVAHWEADHWAIDAVGAPPPAQNSKAGKMNQRATASIDIARRTPGHRQPHRSATTATMPALQKMDLQRKAA
jgi:hypothetical protein